ncbi:MULTISPECIES: hypothetical protein [unclassified Streptomyces]|uniref:hypothetical protein n=1 Tax=unclassified Streptomyces TaxID=2593676 RepID=UPI00345054F5
MKSAVVDTARTRGPAIAGAGAPPLSPRIGVTATVDGHTRIATDRAGSYLALETADAVIVGLNGLRLLRDSAWNRAAQDT